MLEDEIFIDESNDDLQEETGEGEIILDTEDALTLEENDLFVANEIQEITDTPVDFNDYLDLIEDADQPDNTNDGTLFDEIHDIQANLENVNQEEEQRSEEQEDDNSDDILQSLLITQQNIKTGFDNLSLIGSVQIGLIAFGIGAIIVYCYIGNIK